MFRTQAKTLKSTLPLHTRTFIQHFTKLCILHLAHSSFLDFKSVRAASGSYFNKTEAMRGRGGQEVPACHRPEARAG